jgi:methylmalonyl-CoA/ethylmalonyl-CoA epimerase
MEQIPGILGGPVVQVGIIVSNLEEALRHWSAICGVDRWRCHTFGPNGAHLLRGAPTMFASVLALNDATPQIELIQPLTGTSVHSEWLAEHGAGLHHVAFDVPSLTAATEAMAALGYAEIQSGTGFGTLGAGDGGYAYYDAAAALGIVVEAIEQPSKLPPPDRIWTTSQVA